MSFAASSSILPGSHLHTRVAVRERCIRSTPPACSRKSFLRNGHLERSSNTAPAASRTSGVVQTTSVEPSTSSLVNGTKKSVNLSEGPLGEVAEIDLEEFLNISGDDKSDDLPKGQVIRIPEGTAIEPGAQLTSDLTIGKEMGGGVQGAVYDLVGQDGKSANKLLKIMKYKEATAVTGMDISLQREWLIGQQINKLASHDGDIPGFMRTGAAVLEGKDGLQLVGLVIDKLNGWALEKRFWKDEAFADIKYSLEMVTQVLRALDRAERKLGFLHNDMRIANIMEHRPESESTYIPKGFYSKKAPIKVKLDGDKKARPLVFKIIDYGHARLVGPNKAQKLPEAPLMEKSYRTWFEGRGDVWRLLQDLSDSIDGRTWPMQDAAEVLLLLGLIKEVTGIKVHAFFAPKNAPAAQGLPWEKLGGFGHDIRRNSIRARAYLFAKGADYKPADALKWLEENRHERTKLSAHDDEEDLSEVGFRAKIE